jgi:hypothetical protein
MYNPSQPRVPSGDRYGGRWTGTGLGGGPAHGPHHGPAHGAQLASGSAAAMGARTGLAPLNPAMLHYLRRLLTEMVAGSPLYIYGGLLIAAIDELRAAHGALPGHPDIHYRYKDGVLTLVQDVPGDNKPLLFHGPAGADGLYRLPDGTIIGHDLGSGVFLNEIAIVLEGRKRRALTSARDSDAVNDDIKLCPDPVPDRPSAKTMSDRAKLYQHQITNLPIGMAVMLNDRMPNY